MSGNESDVSDTCVAKSDQLNADDLVSGPITVTVTGVKRTTEDQPISIGIEGRQPFKPCKTMRRVLVAAWGKDATKWAGRLMTLVRDPNVKWAGEAVGGIRIQALSHIDRPLEMSLSESRKSKKKYVIQVLQQASSVVSEWTGKINAAATLEELKSLAGEIKSSLSAKDATALRGAYAAREKQLKESAEADGTNKAARQEIARKIEECKSSADASRLMEEISAALEAGQITKDESDMLTATLKKEIE